MGAVSAPGGSGFVWRWDLWEAGSVIATQMGLKWRWVGMPAKFGAVAVAPLLGFWGVRVKLQIGSRRIIHRTTCNIIRKIIQIKLQVKLQAK